MLIYYCINIDMVEEHSVYWLPKPPESPDLNPIENIWGSLKQIEAM